MADPKKADPVRLRVVRLTLKVTDLQRSLDLVIAQNKKYQTLSKALIDLISRVEKRSCKSDWPFERFEEALGNLRTLYLEVYK